MGNDAYIWDLAQVFEKWLNYVGNHLDLWEISQKCGEMTQLFDKRLKNVENDLEIWEMAKIFGKWLRYMGHGLRNGFTMFEMAYEFDKRLKYVGNDVYMW